MPLSILINGSRGRMGHALADAAKEMGVTIGGAVDLGDYLAAGLARSDVVVDFTGAYRLSRSTKLQLRLANAFDILV